LSSDKGRLDRHVDWQMLLNGELQQFLKGLLGVCLSGWRTGLGTDPCFRECLICSAQEREIHPSSEPESEEIGAAGTGKNAGTLKGELSTLPLGFHQGRHTSLTEWLDPLGCSCPV
jgi:hypothetical protein